MNCRMAEEEIQKSLDGILRHSERERLDAHLASCAACRQAWAEYRLLARAAGRWAHPTHEDDPGEAFNARVLARIAVQTTPAPASSLWWLPLTATLCLMVLLAWLPGLHWASGEVIGATARQTPAWFWTNLHTVSWNSVTAWASPYTAIPLPNWTWGVLLVIGAVNAAFYRQARLSQSQRSLS